jgi:hypothetical protein
MPVLSHLSRERHGFDHRFVANDNDACGAFPAARDVDSGKPSAFAEHRSMAAVVAAERHP